MSPLLEELYIYWTRKSRLEELSSRVVNHHNFPKGFLCMLEDYNRSRKGEKL